MRQKKKRNNKPKVSEFATERKERKSRKEAYKIEGEWPKKWVSTLILKEKEQKDWQINTPFCVCTVIINVTLKTAADKQG